MASYDYTFTSGDTVTPTKLNNARNVKDIVNADIKSDAAIALSKLATGALPTAITVASANLVDGTIVNADVNATAAIALSKLATGALPAAITVASANIVDGTIVNADINASAAIAHSKLANVSAGQVLLGNASNVPTATALSGDVTVNSSGVTAIGSGVIVNADINNSAAIGLSKLANITAGQVLLGNASNVPTATALSGDVTVNSSGVTAIGSAKVLPAMLTGAQTGSAPIFGVRAWGKFAGQASNGACAVSASGNVTSVSRISVGIYEVVMTTALPDANYAITCASNVRHAVIASFTETTTTFRLDFRDGSNVADDPVEASFMVIR